jgi:hypothetical protein
VGLGLDHAWPRDEKKLALAHMDGTDFKRGSHETDFTLAAKKQGVERDIRPEKRGNSYKFEGKDEKLPL